MYSEGAIAICRLAALETRVSVTSTGEGKGLFLNNVNFFKCLI